MSSADPNPIYRRIWKLQIIQLVVQKSHLVLFTSWSFDVNLTLINARVSKSKHNVEHTLEFKLRIQNWEYKMIQVSI